MLSEDVIKQIFFHSDRPRRDAILADEVDIVQFARHIEAYLMANKRRPEMPPDEHYDPSQSLIEIKRRITELEEFLASPEPDLDETFIASQDLMNEAFKIAVWSS